ncbi:MAG: metal ABC transporter substrate-binding protein, partial [Ilumatobacteraceae bacterium]
MPKSGSVNLRKFLSTALLLGVLVSCGSSGDSTNSNESTAQTAPDSVVADLPVIAVTYSVIGNIVSQLVGDNATVTVVISDGQDPHDFQPSAKDIETINNAALVVSNGLEFEEGLEEVLENIAKSSGKIFMVGEHITVRKIEDGDDHKDDDHGDKHSDKHVEGDPHLWLSPATMLEMLPALTTALTDAVGADLSAEATALTTKLQDLDG